MARSESNGGTRSCSSDSSATISGGIRSGRVDSTWPNFTKIGPSSSSARRRRIARGEVMRRQKNSVLISGRCAAREAGHRDFVEAVLGRDREDFKQAQEFQDHQLSDFGPVRRNGSGAALRQLLFQFGDALGAALDVVAQAVHVAAKSSTALGRTSTRRSSSRNSATFSASAGGRRGAARRPARAAGQAHGADRADDALEVVLGIPAQPFRQAARWCWRTRRRHRCAHRKTRGRGSAGSAAGRSA
jgi:hypothetical protein